MTRYFFSRIHDYPMHGVLTRRTPQLHINTQGSTHWDGLRHYPYQDTLLYYNGVTQKDIFGAKANGKLGVQSKCKPSMQRQKQRNE